MIRGHYYKVDTGLLTGVSMTASIELIAANCPAGCHWVTGDADSYRQRVELITDDYGDAVPELVPWQPPKPSDTELQRWVWHQEALQWVPELTTAAHAANTRLERDRHLAACDWVVTKAQETGQPVPKPWREYRQALRDVSKQPGFPTDVVWPIKPE